VVVAWGGYRCVWLVTGLVDESARCAASVVAVPCACAAVY
jgi:hypothetical protein